MPILDLFLEKNPISLLAQRIGLNNTVFPVTLFAQTRSNERAGEIQKIKTYGLPEDQSNPRGVDLLTKFSQAAFDHPEFMDDTRILTSCTSMVFAGSETTAISLSSIFYFLLKHPQVYAKLMKELDDAVTDGIVEARADKTVSWAESQKLPYLDAVIQESFRLHPAPGLMLERIVPPQGMDILGNFIPGGTIVGCNAWVLHRRPEIFGADVDSFKPERWIEARQEKLKEMKATMFQFGAGARTCIGKNVSLLEVYKLVPSFLRRFEVSHASRIWRPFQANALQIELEHPDAEWKTHNAWFVRQESFNTRFRAREASV
jgi:cytochrome P450